MFHRLATLHRVIVKDLCQLNCSILTIHIIDLARFLTLVPPPDPSTGLR